MRNGEGLARLREGYLSLYDPDVTYFGPTGQARIDGREALQFPDAADPGLAPGRLALTARVLLDGSEPKILTHRTVLAAYTHGPVMGGRRVPSLLPAR
ncbi:MAG: hypothetical protein ABR606_18760 [Vicinamibacterales bacterium]